MPFNTAGNLLYIPDFVFKNGTTRDKYFLVIASNKTQIVVVSLPTSQNYTPSHIRLFHGCNDSPEDCFNCYFFEAKRIICDVTGFSFRVNTFLYGEWVDTYEISQLSKITKHKIEGQLNKNELDAIITCFKKSQKVKRKIKKLI